MSPDVELELRRLGGINGTIKLLRPPATGESSDIYARRVELATALLACKIGLDSALKKCGATTSTSAGLPVDGLGCQQWLMGRSPVNALRESWEPKALTVVIDTLLRGRKCVFVGNRTRCFVVTLGKIIRRQACRSNSYSYIPKSCQPLLKPQQSQTFKKQMPCSVCELSCADVVCILFLAESASVYQAIARRRFAVSC